MKVLHLSSDLLFTPLYKELLSKIECSDIQCLMYSPVAYKTIYNEMPSNVSISACFNKYDSFFYHSKQKKIFKDINQKIDIQQFDLLHAHFLFSNGFTAMKIKQKYNIPYLVAVRNTDINIFFRYMLHLRRIGIEILRNAQKIIFLSTTYREKLLKNYVPKRFKDEVLCKSEVIPNGIDPFWLAHVNTPKKLLDSKKLKIIVAGTIEKNKNHMTTLAACKILVDRGYDVQFVVVGRSLDNTLRAKLIREQIVQYIPNQPQEELIKLYRGSDIFIMPSVNETFGLAYAEAMSQGLPLIYTRGQGFDEQFEDGQVGYSVSCSDSQEITDKIVMIIEDYESISRRCIALAHKFDWNKIARAYTRIYREMVS